MIAKEEGVTAFWKGINAAWLRESSYTSLRLGLYSPIKEVMGATSPDAAFYKKFLSGSLAGAIGSLAGNPFDVLKVRAGSAFLYIRVDSRSTLTRLDVFQTGPHRLA